MNKSAVIKAIKELASAGVISEDEIVTAYREASGVETGEVSRRQERYSGVLYFIGGGVIFIGIVALIAQVWRDLGAVMHIVVTLGSGLAAYVVGVLLSWSERVGAAGMGFFLIAALVLPVGMAITLDEAGLDLESLGLQSLISLVLMSAFLVAYALFKANSLLVYVVFYATWAVFGFSSYLVGSDPRFPEVEFFEYRVLAVGLSYMVLAYAFAGTRREGLSGALYGFGSMAFLGAALGLGGWKPSQSIFWELVFPGLAFAVLYASAHVKSKALLTFSSIFLGAYLSKLTGEYFSDSLGWPLALVLVGLMLMGLGYVTLRLKRTYLVS